MLGFSPYLRTRDELLTLKNYTEQNDIQLFLGFFFYDSRSVLSNLL